MTGAILRLDESSPTPSRPSRPLMAVMTSWHGYDVSIAGPAVPAWTSAASTSKSASRIGTGPSSLATSTSSSTAASWAIAVRGDVAASMAAPVTTLARLAAGGVAVVEIPAAVVPTSAVRTEPMKAMAVTASTWIPRTQRRKSVAKVCGVSRVRKPHTHCVGQDTTVDEGGEQVKTKGRTQSRKEGAVDPTQRRLANATADRCDPQHRRRA